MRELEPMGVVTTADATALGLFSQALAEYIAAKELVERDGLVVKGRDGGPIANPALRIERDRWMLVWRAGEAFGLTPSARVTLGSTMPTRMDELEQLLS
jgi:P27 family predicted phage terminase small subunit